MCPRMDSANWERRRWPVWHDRRTGAYRGHGNYCDQQQSTGGQRRWHYDRACLGMTSGDVASFTGTGGQIADSGVAYTNIPLLNAANTFTKNQQATGMKLDSVANAAAPTGAATNSGQSVPASTTNEAALTCIDSSGANTTVGTASANVTTTGGSSYIVWSYTLPSGCTTGYIWMKNTGSFSYYSAASGSSFTQNAAATTYTAAASYPVGGAYPTANTTGIFSGWRYDTNDYRTERCFVKWGSCSPGADITQ